MAENIFIAWLKGRHDEIMDCERRALNALGAGDKALYSENMREKAEKLKALHRLALPRLGDLPEGARCDVEEELSRFSQGAATALSLGSLFYMSALLYPDDHKPGEPDNLERLIKKLEKGAGG